MNYVGKVFSSVRGYIGINQATLTGAIDIIAIRKDDGSYISSPWHVRFGKMGVIRAKQKVVDIEINGEPVDLHMKLGEAGEAFFVEEADIAEVPLHLATSPLQTGGLDLMERGLLEMKELSTPDHQSEPATPVIENGGELVVTMEGNSPVVSVIPKTSLAQSLPESGVFAKVMERQQLSRLIMNEVSTQTEMSGNDVDLQKSGFPGDSVLERDAVFQNVQSSIELTTGWSRLTPDLVDLVRTEPGIFVDPTPRKVCSLDPDVMTTADETPQTLAFTDSVLVEMSGHLKPAEMKLIKSGSVDAMDDCQFEMELDDDESEVGVFRRRVSSLVLDRSSFLNNRMEKRNQFVSIYQSFSDTDLTPVVSPSDSRPASPKSDTELDVVRNDATSQTQLTGDKLLQMDDLLWKWGEFPETTSSAANCLTTKDDLNKSDTKPAAKMLPSGGIYLDDLKQEEMDPELIGLYLYDNRRLSKAVEDDRESGRGVSLPQSPVTVLADANDIMTSDATTANQTMANLDVAMSLCGAMAEEDGEAVAIKFQQNVITHEALCSNPNLFSDPNLVIRISGKYYKWQVAGPMIMSVLVFNKSLKDTSLDILMKQHMPKKEQQRKRWLTWWGGKETAAPLQGPEKLNPSMSKDTAASAPSSQASSPPDTPQKVKDRSRSLVKDYSSSTNDIDTIALSAGQLKLGDDAKEVVVTGKEAYKKSLKLSSDQIAKLNLNEGANEVTFSVTTQYQGTTRCTCYIFLWNWNDRIIVSDIDGTITRSDVLGQVLPMIGQVLPYINDWSQVGIAKLYSMIASNGYKFLYLSARAIGQSKITRDYLRSIRQGDVSLPDGPLLLSPSSLVSAFHKEVIERKPEEFKISCLKDIKELFPSTINPFLAGFGNRINDVWAYTTIGIPRSRIFTVNHKGQLRIETLQSFESSYTRLSDIVDHFFPPLDAKMQARNLPYINEFSAFNYWRNTLPDVESELDHFLKTAATAAAVAAAVKKQNKKARPQKKKS